MIQQISSHNVLKNSIILTHSLNHPFNIIMMNIQWTNLVLLFFQGDLVIFVISGSLNCTLLFTTILPSIFGDIFGGFSSDPFLLYHYQWKCILLPVASIDQLFPWTVCLQFYLYYLMSKSHKTIDVTFIVCPLCNVEPLGLINVSTCCYFSICTAMIVVVSFNNASVITWRKRISNVQKQSDL